MEETRLLRQPALLVGQLVSQIETRVLGKREAIRQLLIAVLAGGHVLIEDVPGTGKTLLVKTVAQTIGCSFRRIQFTPDLLPSDIVGTTIYNQRTAAFEFRAGPLGSAHLLLADEINRSSPRTQAALLEAMEEGQLTVDGTSHGLPDPFIVLATQNPLDHEGTYPLPEAQLDRFMLRVRLGYPDADAEKRMLENELEQSGGAGELLPVVSREALLRLRRMVGKVYVDEAVKRYIVELARATRSHPELRSGVSPRATIALMKAAQAGAFMDGRDYVIPDDVKALVKHVFGHRLQGASPLPYPGADADAGGITGVDKALEAIVARTPIPYVPSASAVGEARR